MSRHIRNRNVAPFDVDDTLIMHNYDLQLLTEHRRGYAVPELVIVKDPLTGSDKYFRKNENMLRLMAEEKAQGSFIIVWSRGGDEWAKAVVEALGLSDVVDLILTKPMAIFDDKPIQEWLPYRVYIGPDERYKR